MLSFLGLTFLLTSCLEPGEITTAVPSIVEIQPTSGAVGDEIIITGNNFGTTVSDNTVQFNGVLAELKSAAKNTLIVTVPAEATTGKILITVDELAVVSGFDFTITEIQPEAPIISSFEPAMGQAGDKVIITGQNFSETLEENNVTFGELTATITEVSATSIVVTVPADVKTGKLVVEVNGFTTMSASDFVVLVEPAITSFEPNIGAVGTVVMITGTNFSQEVSENEVRFNDVLAEISSATATSIAVTVPEGATTGKIEVKANGLSSTSASDFTVVEQVAINSINPAFGVVGTEVTIEGENFSSIASENLVKFNGAEAEVISASSETITVLVPLQATSGRVSVIVNENTVDSSVDFEVLVPSINSITPLFAVTGDDLTISGENFSLDPQSNVVSINGVEAEVTAAASDRLTVTVPQGSGIGKVSVAIGPQMVESSSNFEYQVDIPKEGLVAFYPFDENSNDESGNDLHGVANGATLAIDRFGNANQAYSFDGTDDYIDMGNPTELQISGKITVGLWTRSSSFVNSRILVSKTDRVDGYIFDTGELGDGSQGYSVFVYSSTETGTNFARLSDDYVADEWTFLAFTLDDANITFYQNGVETFSYNKAPPVTNGTTGNFQIGGGDNHFFYTGDIDDVTVYNRALSSEEIVQLFNQNVTKN